MTDLAKEAERFIKETKRLAAKSKPERLFETVLGRSLEDYETVLFKDGNHDNLDLDNMMLGFKAGVPYRYLICGHCGNRVIRLKEPDSLEAGAG